MTTVRSATGQDWPVLESLLQANGLPVAGAKKHLDAYLVAVRDDELVAAAGLEVHGDAGLLRSVAVAPGRQRQGLGRLIVDAMLAEARSRGLARLYLLTTTAADYFERRGFVRRPRGAEPEALSGSEEFRGACPASAQLMSLELEAPANGSTIRIALPSDARAIADIYAPVVRDTTISFELDAPSEQEMEARITATLKTHPWLVSIDAHGSINGYAYAGRHRDRAAYQWSVDVTAYVRADARRQGVGRRLYARLFEDLVRLGYFQAFAGIALPNDASVGLHESSGFEPIGVYRRVGFKQGAWRDVGWWQKELQPVGSDPPAPAAFRGGQGLSANAACGTG